MSLILWGIGLVLIVEGLAFALAPLRMEDLLRALARIGRDHRRMIGLAAMSVGGVLIWLAGALAG